MPYATLPKPSRRGHTRSPCTQRLLSAALALLLAAGPLRAQQLSEGAYNDERSAELFREGRRLLSEGRFAEGCTKFDESLKLKRSPGTLLNVGSCRAATGDLVAAVDAFGAAIALAEQEPASERSQAWLDAGRRELAEARARVAELTVVPAPGETLNIKLDDEPFGAAGTPRLVNPGEHRLEAGLGERRYRLRLKLSGGERRRVEVPSLAEPEPAPTPLPQAPPPRVAEAPREVPPVSVVLFATGGVLLVGGAATGLLTSRKTSNLAGQCPGEVCPEGHEPLREARTLATVTDVLVITGLVSAGAGAAWYFWGPRAEPPARATARCTLTACGVELSGSF